MSFLARASGGVHGLQRGSEMVLHTSTRKVAVMAVTGLLVAGAAGTATASQPQWGHEGPFKGQVTARTGLNVRTGPSTRHRVLDVLPFGTVVKIKCKVNGQNVAGNPRWYKLNDKRFAKGFASARYIRNIGPAPRFCREKPRMMKDTQEQNWKEFGQPKG
jgi:SH3 domain-containing protein